MNIWEECSVEMDAKTRIAAVNRVIGALVALMRRRNFSTAAPLAVHNAVLVPTLIYGTKRGYCRRRMKER